MIKLMRESISKICATSLVGVSLMPLVSLAQGVPSGCGSTGNFGGIKGFICDAGMIVDMLTVLVAGIALLVFFWGLTKFIAKAGDSKAHEEGRSLMIWGAIALFVMISIWGIVQFIQDNLDIHQETVSPTLFGS